MLGARMTEPESSIEGQQYLAGALEQLAEVCPDLKNTRLKDWYVITTHLDEGGDETLSRFQKNQLAPWTCLGLLTFALDQERREWAEDDVQEEAQPKFDGNGASPPPR